MTDAGYTHITILADRTGSMSASAGDGKSRAETTTKGIHDLIKEQRALPGKLTVSLVDFMCASRSDQHIDRVAWFASPSDKALSQWQCNPYGGTPLLDAVGRVIADTGTELEKMPEDERPGSVVFVIATDGEENSSIEYDLASVKQMVKDQQDKYQWQFIFLGVDIDAFSDGDKMGFAAGATMGNSGGGVAMAATYQVTNSAISRYRSSGGSAGGQSVTYSSDERDVVAAAEAEDKTNRK